MVKGGPPFVSGYPLSQAIVDVASERPTRKEVEFMIDEAIENLKKEIRGAGIKWLLTR